MEGEISMQANDTLQLIAEKQADVKGGDHLGPLNEMERKMPKTQSAAGAAPGIAKMTHAIQAAEDCLLQKQHEHFREHPKELEQHDEADELRISSMQATNQNTPSPGKKPILGYVKGEHSNSNDDDHCVPTTQLRTQSRVQVSQPGAFPSQPVHPDQGTTSSEEEEDEESPCPQVADSSHIEGLVEATPLGQEALQSAQPVQKVPTTPESGKKVRLILLLGLCMLLLVVGLPLLLVFPKAQGADLASAGTDPLVPDHGELTLVLDLPINSLLPQSTLRVLQMDIDQGTTSSQSKAYRWLQQDPGLGSYSTERLLQRFAAATFFYDTNGPEWIHPGGGVFAVEFGLPPKTGGGGDKPPPQDNTNMPWSGHVNVTSEPWLSYGTEECDWFSRPLRPDQEVEFGQDESLLCGSNGTFVRHLRLSGNNLTNQLPPELGLLRHLETLVLNGNPLLQGTLPREIGMLTRLQDLSLKDTNLQGTIPSQIGLLSNSLRAFGTNNNDLLSGTLPDELWKLSRLLELSLPRNQFSGTLPNDICKTMPNLTRLILAGNTFSGTLPSSLALCSNLVDINLADLDRLVGSIPSEIGLLGNKELRFNIRGTSLTGTIPQELCNGNSRLDFDCSDSLCGCDCPCA